MTVVDAKTLADPRRAETIAEAVRRKIMTEGGYSGQAELDRLSSRTEVDDVDVYDDQIMFDGRNFSGLCDLSVTLNYHDTEGLDWRTDTFSARFWGYFEKGRVVVEDVTVDTAPFFE